MNLTSYFANKCIEFLIALGEERYEKQKGTSPSSKTGSTSLSPPWIKDTHFCKRHCDGCGKCIAKCENNILFQDEEGFPQVDFSKGSCTFCGNCAESCPNDVFDYEVSKQPWNLKAVITLNCLSHNNVLCRTCAEHCEEGAIIVPRANGSISPPHILAERCNGCGACFSPCPVRAINITSKREEE